MAFWEISSLQNHWQLLLEILLRLAVAAICGAVVGYERTKRLKEAGLRTHCVVAIAAALVMIVSKYGFYDVCTGLGLLEFTGGKGIDASRIASNVVAGIGFLGAGVIFKNGNVIRGITTAAGIFATAAIGLCIGSGLYIVGIFCTAFIMLIQFLMHKFPVGNDTFNTNEIVITMLDTPESREMVRTHIKSDWALIVGSKAYVDDNGERMFQLTIKASGSFPPEKMMKMMDEFPDIRSISM